ncbi:Ribosomal RNA small subunit methyltransferase I [Buchnera aphidicola (Pterocallis alni)]|uniref:16S rRNA (cytidine(1402)-2'-O)-methyltransferase n=1 Tax=Buchnera aphidicola TaxID=9 RepID=UPI003463917F
MNNKNIGILYIVPTPIGNIQDISDRALNILKTVHLIIAENTKYTNNLLKILKIKNTIISFHKYNENNQTQKIISLLKTKTIALVSNAGTPVINDPGYELVHTCHKENITVIPIPGPCAAITALSASGLSSNTFYYAGFIPKKKNTRINFLKKIKNKQTTVILYESCHRIIHTLNDITNILGSKRKIVFAKEITKKWEKIKYGTSIQILTWLQKDPCRQKGEITLLIKHKKKKKKIISSKIKKTLHLLIKYLSMKKSIELISKIFKIKKNDLYKYTINQFQHDKK